MPFIDGFEFKYLIGVMTVVCALANLYSMFSVIFTGGVGKNGSTVAVSLIKQKNEMIFSAEDTAKGNCMA